MSDDKIAEIRKRHEQSEKNYIELESTWKAQIHEDRSFLLAEVERHRAEIEKLRAALEGIRIDGPDAHGLLWVTIQHPSIATRSHAMVGSMDRMVSQALLEFEQIRRNALEGKP
jgi:hypothetical protein